LYSNFPKRKACVLSAEVLSRMQIILRPLLDGIKSFFRLLVYVVRKDSNSERKNLTTDVNLLKSDSRFIQRSSADFVNEYAMPALAISRFLSFIINLCLENAE